MLQALATLGFVTAALGAIVRMARIRIQDWEAVLAAFGLRKPMVFSPLPPRYRVNSRRATFVRMEAAPLRRAA